MNVTKGLNIFILVFMVVSLAYINFFIEYNPTLVKVFYSVVILLFAYITNIFIEGLIKKQIRQTKERYTIRKAISTIISILTFGSILAVWFKETTALVVAYGLLSAGVAIALQDMLKSIAGGIIIILTGPFKAGDRIQVENDMGDVLDIKLFYTTIMV